MLGASGGVGSIIVSAAHAAGAAVAGQTGNEDNTGWIKGRGADQAVVANASTLADAVADLRPTVVFDGLGGGFTGAAIEALQPHGRLALFGTSAGPEGQVSLQSLYRKGITVLGYAGLLESDQDMAAAIRRALQALATGQLSAPIDSAMPLHGHPDRWYGAMCHATAAMAATPRPTPCHPVGAWRRRVARWPMTPVI